MFSDSEGTGENFIIEIAQTDSGEISSNLAMATPGVLVTITATPGPGFVPTQVTILAAGQVVPSTRMAISSEPVGYIEWTFSMPTGNVQVRGTFEGLDVAARRVAESLPFNSSWEEIADANALLRRAEAYFDGSSAPSATTNVSYAITALQTFIPIRMRSETAEWSAWFPAATGNRPPPALQLQTGTALNMSRTHLYFVGLTLTPTTPAVAPALARAGWTVEPRVPSTSTIPVEPPGEAFAGGFVQKLNFQVGSHASRVETYEVLFVPVAQYNLVRGSNVSDTAGINISEFSVPRGRWSDDYRERNIPWGVPATQNQMQRIGEAWYQEFDIESPTAEGIFVRMEAPSGFAFTVAASPSDPAVLWHCGCFIISPATAVAPCADPMGLNTNCGVLDDAGLRTRGFFIPRSRTYTITLATVATP